MKYFNAYRLLWRVLNTHHFRSGLHSDDAPYFKLQLPLFYFLQSLIAYSNVCFSDKDRKYVSSFPVTQKQSNSLARTKSRHTTARTKSIDCS